MIFPSIFAYTSALGYSPTMAGLLLAMTPLATSIHAIIQNVWTKRSFKNPMIFGTVICIVSHILYIYAYQANSLYFLMFARFLFGLAGSKVVHRKYIANYVDKNFWNKYYTRLIYTSFAGMIVGPICYLGCIYLTMNYTFLPPIFLMPAYFGVFTFALLFLFLLLFFRKHKYIKASRVKPRKPPITLLNAS